MPIWVFRCSKCGHKQETIRDNIKCEKCGGEMIKQMAPPGLIYIA